MPKSIVDLVEGVDDPVGKLLMQQHKRDLSPTIRDDPIREYPPDPFYPRSISPSDPRTSA
jgi:hypothetical protein